MFIIFSVPFFSEKCVKKLIIKYFKIYIIYIMSSMIKFLKLTNRAINIAHIKRIDFDKTKLEYKIFINDSSFRYVGYSILGTGSIASEMSMDYIYANKEEHPESYNIIDEFYKKIE